MLIGAGDAGMTILRDVNKNMESSSRVVCIIDDNSNKIGRYIEGVPVVGGRDDILKYVEKYNLSDKVYRELLDTCYKKYEKYKDSKTYFCLKDHLWNLYLYERFKHTRGNI